MQAHIGDVFEEHSVQCNDIECYRTNRRVFLERLYDRLSDLNNVINESSRFNDDSGILAGEEVVFEPAENVVETCEGLRVQLSNACLRFSKLGR